ncbi:MAG: tRNA (N(6)-L-threonylcarbamoyladenosine(37)-C(2))-methylthiotransferase MtaB [Fusobacteriaceae bacterium]
MNLNKTVAFYTLGCKVNQYESESIKNQLIKYGYENVSFESKSDIYIINSCTVTSIADKKTRNMIRRAKKMNPASIVILTGCYAQTNSKELMEIEEIDYVVGNVDKQSIIKLINELDEKKQNKILNHNVFESEVYEEYEFATLREMTRAYVKIQDGCNSFCSYCKIPFARGRSRSRELKNILLEIKKLVEEGFKEVIFIGINIGSYGEDLKEVISFEDLINAAVKIVGIERIRFGSVYPDKISDEFISLFSNEKVVPHIHVSLQSCDDNILKMMKRNYGTSLIEERLLKLREMVPKLEFTADVIVGFPGETMEMHKNTYNLIEKIGFSDLHVFQYSDRENTVAEKLPNKVGPKEKKERAEELQKLRENMVELRRQKYLNKNLKVLVEEIKGSYAFGHSENYIKVKINNENIVVGNIYEVLLKKVEKELLVGEKKK